MAATSIRSSSLSSIDFDRRFTNFSAADFNFTSTNASCVRIQDYLFDYVDLLPVQATFGSAYTIVFLLGLAANCATLRCLISFDGGGRPRTPTTTPATNANGTSRAASPAVASPAAPSPAGKRSGVRFGVSREFLISLTLADLLLIGCTSLPLTAVQIFTRRWVLGEYACQFGPLIQGVGCFVTSFSLSSIALERYCMIASNRKIVGRKMRGFLVALIWTLAVAASIPLVPVYKLQRECVVGVGCFCGVFCDEVGWATSSRTVYGIFAFALQYVLPACVLAFCYFKVRQRVERSVQTRLAREHVSLVSQQRLSRRKTRTSYMTLLLFAGFACPWLPMCLFNVLRDLEHLSGSEWYATAFASGHLVAMTSILWNPIVYCWANRNFRAAFTAALFCGYGPPGGGSTGGTGGGGTDEDYEERYYGDTGTVPGYSIRTTNGSSSIFGGRSSIRRSTNGSSSTTRSSAVAVARSRRSSSRSSGRQRSRLGTASSLGPHVMYKPMRPSSWQHDVGGPVTLLVPTVRADGSSLTIETPSPVPDSTSPIRL